MRRIGITCIARLLAQLERICEVTRPVNWSPVKKALGLLALLLFLVTLISVGRFGHEKVKLSWQVAGVPVSIPLGGLILLVATVADTLFAAIVRRMAGLMSQVTDSDEQANA